MLRARKHKRVSTTKVSNQKPEAEFCQHPSASCVANQVPREPKSPLSRRVWKPKQKSSTEASGVATPKPRPSREEKGKMPVCSNHKIKTAIIPSPNSRAAMPCASIVLMSEATIPQHTHCAHGREARARVLSKAHPLYSSIVGKAPLRALSSSASSTKFASDGEARTEALFSANPFCRDKRSRTSSYLRSKRAFALDCRDPTGSDLRKLLTDRQTSSPCCQQVGCQLVTLHSVHCRLGPIPATPPRR